MPTDLFLDALKSQTRELHVQLEAHVDILKRLQSLDGYQQLLAAFYGFYAPVETQLAECTGLSAAGLELQPRLKVPLLASDLNRRQIDVAPLPQATNLPSVVLVPQAFGCLYVMEGATLGSQIIKRLLAQQLEISTENGGAFFNAYGDRVGEMWESFRVTLSQYAAARPEERGLILAAAQETFSKLDAWFMRCLP